MKLVAGSREFTAEELVRFVMGADNQKMSARKNEWIEIESWLKYEEPDSNGDVKSLLAVMATDGQIYVTNSPSFMRDFDRITGIYESLGESVKRIKVVSGYGKSGREFISCGM